MAGVLEAATKLQGCTARLSEAVELLAAGYVPDVDEAEAILRQLGDIAAEQAKYQNELNTVYLALLACVPAHIQH